MKKISVCFIATLTLSTSFLKSQNSFPSSGNAAVGTSSPTVPFEIATTLTQGATIFKFSNPQQNNQIIFKDRDFSNFLFGLQSNQIKIGVPGSDHKIMSIQSNANNITMWPTFSINSGADLILNPTQNVGIGTSSPAYKLDVNGSVNATQLLINGTAIGSLNTLWLSNANGIYYNGAGNVGIGTTAPSAPLEIGTTLTQGATVFKFGNPQQLNQIIFRDRSYSSLLYGLEANQIKIGLSGSDHKIMSTQANSQNIELYPTVSINSPNNILINSGQNVGIGTANPQHKLDINGDAGITGNLFVGGGIITSNTVNVGVELNAGDAIINNNLNVSGNSTFQGQVTASQGINFDANNNGIHFTPAAGNNPNVFSFGGIDPGPITINPCYTIPLPSFANKFGGLVQIFDNTGGFNPNGGVINILGNGTKSYIDARGGTVGGLDINNFCGQDVNICTGSNGGIVRLSDNVKVGTNGNNIPYRMLTVNGDVSLANYLPQGSNGNANDGMNGLEILGNDQTPVRRGITTDADPNGDLNFYINSNQAPSEFKFKNGIGNKTLATLNSFGYLDLSNQAGTGPAYTIRNKTFSNANEIVFNVDVDGKTQINSPTATSKAFVVNTIGNSSLSENLLINGDGSIVMNIDPPTTTNPVDLKNINTGVSFFRVKNDGRIFGREVIVTLNPFPDYVFTKNYKQMSLADVKLFTEENHRLPNMPSAKEIEKDGAALGEIQRLTVEKVEELYKYVFELETELKDVKKKLESLEKK